jgi:hypothetical protein
LIYEIEDVIRTIDDHIDLFESIGVLLKEKNGFIKSNLGHLDSRFGN